MITHLTRNDQKLFFEKEFYCMKKMLVLLLAALMCLTSVASADEAVYVLMNIPYAEFYEAENAVDAITSATLKGKARNTNVIGASYHQSEEAVTTEGIAGAIYPVKADPADLAALGVVEVTDDAALNYTFTAKGKETEVSLTGADTLIENPNYSYYVMSEAPAAYKELTVENDVPVFSAVAGTPVSGKASGEVSYTGHHADIEISLEGVEADPALISGAIITMDNGTNYAMHQVVNIWRGELGWDLSDLDLGGQTITAIRFLLKNGSIYDYETEIKILPAYKGSEFSGMVNADMDTFVLDGSLNELENAVMTVICTVCSGKGVPSDVVFSGEASNDAVNLDTVKIAELAAAGEAGAEVMFSATIDSSNYATVMVGVE